MVRLFRRFTVFYATLILVILFISTIIGISTYKLEQHQIHKNDYHNIIKDLYDKTKVQSLSTSNYWKSITKEFVTTSQLIFPNGINLKDPKQYILDNPSLFKDSSIVNTDPERGKVKLPQSILVNNIQDVGLFPSQSTYKPFNLTLFKSDSDIEMDLNKCKDLKVINPIELDNPVHVDLNMRQILHHFLDHLPHNKYYQEVAPFFITELKLQFKHNIIEHYWYRLAGSSVWLEQYGVHLMISRVLYAPRGVRNQPIVSLMYAQIFNENWQELTNTELVIPSDDQKFRIMKFPQFLPIPFYHDYDNTIGKYYGPEDPRILLVKNTFGYEEPMIIFNSYHRKLIGFDDDSDEYVLQKPQFYRSMFVCWPWQFQTGKKNMDVMDKDYTNREYNRVLELKIKNLPRQRTQKNWTPFKSFQSSKTQHTFDNYLYFVYRWANFETLKCSLQDGICGFNYRLNKDLHPMARIGPLRGGTQLVNLNELMSTQTPFHLNDFLPPDREIWLGFARAHIDRCGCGSNMYRPNLVIVVKDTIKVKQPSLFGSNENDDAYTYEDVYRVSHVSSSISFNIPLIGWDLFNPQFQCAGSSILIPNGISSWSIRTTNEGNDHDYKSWKFDDYLTLSMSISDFTIHTINIKGLLNQVLSLNSLFLSQSDQSDDSYLQIPQSVAGANSKLGFNNDNILCALQSSADFCQAYANEQDRLLSKSLFNYHKNDDYRNKYYDIFLDNDDTASNNEIQAYQNELYYAKPAISPLRAQNKPASSPPKKNTRPNPGKSIPGNTRPTSPLSGNSDLPTINRYPPSSSSSSNKLNQAQGQSQSQKQAQKGRPNPVLSSESSTVPKSNKAKPLPKSKPLTSDPPLSPKGNANGKPLPLPKLKPLASNPSDSDSPNLKSVPKPKLKATSPDSSNSVPKLKAEPIVPPSSNPKFDKYKKPKPPPQPSIEQPAAPVDPPLSPNSNPGKVKPVPKKGNSNMNPIT
ncbi:hypothetical protein DFJ63DRAFT_27504 [Scheffersomyces coipomensis]|uniref:uncharacterized protein n=1 Tax=Scheffersomyces coipomensis TaxID=1788519 RepID=UPI00315CDCDC